jgi:outer membrane lipoprotein SlyB
MVGSGGSSIDREKASLGILAGVIGAVAGNAIERMTTKEEAFEIIVQLGNGDRRAIVQAKGNETLLAGDPVIIVTSGKKIRVTRAPR